MQINEVKIYIRNEQKLKAFVTVTLENKLVIHNMKIIQGQQGLLLCMPSRKGPDGKFRDVVHPITNEFRHELEQKVFASYEEEVKKLSQGLNLNKEGMAAHESVAPTTPAGPGAAAGTSGTLGAGPRPETSAPGAPESLSRGADPAAVQKFIQ